MIVSPFIHPLKESAKLANKSPKSNPADQSKKKK